MLLGHFTRKKGLGKGKNEFLGMKKVTKAGMIAPALFVRFFSVF